MDARAAMRLTRQRAGEWKIDAHRIGIMGFSAGGHLAATVATLFSTRLAGESEEDIRRLEHRPDLAVLVYPVISMTEEFGHAGSRRQLLGDPPAPELARLLSPEQQVTERSPPTFLVSTFDDTGVPPLNATAFYRAMCRARVPGELHVWEKGGHGYGILPNRGDVAVEWPLRLEKWLLGRGWLVRQ
jgi:acetyl esterase/lipase